MNLQNYLLCVLYTVLIIAHSFTLSRRDFHRNLISIFSFSLFTQTLATVLFAIHQTAVAYGPMLVEYTTIDLRPIYNIHYFAQLIHITSINFFILFLMIVAKGWPITRREMPFKYAFAIFWLTCLAADLITFYWSTLTLLAKNLSLLTSTTTGGPLSVDGTNSTTVVVNLTTDTMPVSDHKTNLIVETTTKLSLLDGLPSDTEQFNGTPRRLSLLIRIVIMVYFLLELRTTMILEQEQKKLQFYLHFGALSMVWFVHSLIVYVISLRVEIVWQSKLISGFSSAANFLAFAITTRLLWPNCSKSYLFRRQKRVHPNLHHGSTSINVSEEADSDEEYGGLEMKELNGKRYSDDEGKEFKTETVPMNNRRDIPTIRLEIGDN